MRAVMKVGNANDLDVTLTLTMKLSEWKQLKEQMTSKYPSWTLSEAISGLVRRVEQVFSESDDD